MDTFRELLDLGMGALSLTQERAEKAVKKLIRKGKLGKKEGSQIIRALIERGEKERKNLRIEFSKIAREVVGGLNLATKNEVQALRREVAKLKKHRH